MRTILIGGSFNPVHNGHLYIGEEVRKQLNYEQILYVPSFIPPHKENASTVTPFQRIGMLSLALDENEGDILDCEIERGGVSYTIDTVKYLYKTNTVTGKIGLVIGDDLVEGFKKWYRWEDLISMVDLYVVHRKFKKEVDFDIPHSYLKNLMLPLSSADIRKRISAGKAYRYLVPERVYFYIKKHGLYRESDV